MAQRPRNRKGAQAAALPPLLSRQEAFRRSKRRHKRASAKARSPCPILAQYGYCPLGGSCRHAHPPSARAPPTAEATSGKQKSKEEGPEAAVVRLPRDGRVALLDASQLVFYGCGPKARKAAGAMMGGNGTVRGLALLARAIRGLRDDPQFSHLVAVVDGSTKHRLRGGARQQLEDLVERGDVQESPLNTTADDVLLRLAQHYRTCGQLPCLVSNDGFREYPSYLTEGVALVTFFVDDMDTFVLTTLH